MKQRYKVTYTELVLIEATFEAEPDMDEEEWFEKMDADPNAQVRRLDVLERDVSSLEKAS